MPRYERDVEFWEIEREGRVVRTRTGRIGEPGEELVRTHAYEYEAMQDFDGRIEIKVGEGFRPVEASSEAIMDIDPVLGAAVLEALAPERLRSAEGGTA